MADPIMTTGQKASYDALVADSPYVKSSDKANSSDINTGTDDDKYVTSFAISGSNIVQKSTESGEVGVLIPSAPGLDISNMAPPIQEGFAIVSSDNFFGTDGNLFVGHNNVMQQYWSATDVQAYAMPIGGVISNCIFVSKTNGLNTNSGSQSAPVQTIAAAILKCSTASITNPFVMFVEGETFTENITLKENVYYAFNGSTLNGTITLPTTFGSAQSVTWIKDLIWAGSNSTWNYSTMSPLPVGSKLFIDNLRTKNTFSLNLIGAGTNDNIYFTNCKVMQNNFSIVSSNNNITVEGNDLVNLTYNCDGLFPAGIATIRNNILNNVVFSGVSGNEANVYYDGNREQSINYNQYVNFLDDGLITKPTLGTSATYSPSQIADSINVELTPVNYTPVASATGFATTSVEANLRGIDVALGSAIGNGTVTNVSVSSANGFSGSVSNPTSTPDITISTSASGVLKGSAGSLVPATDQDITGKLLTTYVSGAGTVSATDTILQGIQKLNGNDALKALDSAVVHNTGNEFIAGQKVFTTTIAGSINGNAATVTTIPTLSGEVTNSGNAVTLVNNSVTSKVLTGYVSGAGTVSATDSILQAIQKLNGNAATIPTLSGEVTNVGNNVTLSNAAVIAKILTGYVAAAGTVTAADSLLSAIQKVDGNDALKLLISNKATSAEVNTGTDNVKYITSAALEGSNYFQPVYMAANRTASTTTYGPSSAIINTVVEDPNSAYNITTSTFTVPAGKAGFYECSYCLHFTATSTGANQTFRIDTTGYKNGVLSTDLYTVDQSIIAIIGQTVQCTVTNVFSFRLTAGQTISLSAANNGTVPTVTLVSGYLNIKKISD